jgi:hypothetical protein
VSSASTVRRPAGHLRLTRRGRVVIVVLTMALLFAGATLFRATTGHADTGARQIAIVQPGDTLWSLASRFSPHSDPRVVVAKIKSINHLATSDVEPGERLELPA